MSRRAYEVLQSVDTVVGYTTYIDLIRPLVQDKKIVSTPMQKEMQRVEAALEIALEEGSCAVVSSGDPGIYAMAGLALEMCNTRRIPVIPAARTPENPPDASALVLEVIPGIPALCSGASLLGAPLSHDFAVISLSDLLTPWDVIEQRIEAAARADFVIVFYNPKSKRRTRHLETAQKIILNYRDKNTPVGIVTRIAREGQTVRIVPLEHLDRAPVDMQTTVFVGSSSSAVYMDFMITPRGYMGKYGPE